MLNSRRGNEPRLSEDTSNEHIRDSAPSTRHDHRRQQGPGTFTATRDASSGTARVTRAFDSGRTVSDIVTIARGSVGGLSGTVSQNGGPAAQFTATRAHPAGSHDVSVQLTNAAGEHETIDATSKGGSGTVTGTTFSGVRIAQGFTVA